MEGEIPNVDIRVRARLLEWMRLEELEEELEHFHCATGIRLRDRRMWLRAILLVQNPDAFAHPRDDDLELTEVERDVLNLDSEPQRPTQNPEQPAQQDDRPRPRWLPSRWFLTFQSYDYSKWKGLPWHQWRIIILCAIGAVTQGWAEAAVNGAQQWYQSAFQKFIDVPPGIEGVARAPGIVGLINGAPYLCCIFSCWLTPLLNEKLGRRGTIFWSTAFSIVFAVMQARAETWWELFIYRLLMGIGIGPKSATIPIYIAECAPASIRGSLVMFWQVWTAFGIMLGCLSGVALQHLGDIGDQNVCPPNNPTALLGWRCSQNWRYILASPSILPVFLFLYVYGCHESPRWTVAEGHRLALNRRPEAARLYYRKAWKGLKALSRHRLIAARDTLSHYYLLDEERKDLASRLEVHPERSWLVHQLSELVGRRRNRRAILASIVCMFAQQFCGVNLIVYYSNYVFAKISDVPDPATAGIIGQDPAKRLNIDQHALLYTMGFGLINFFFAAPAFFTIDTVGRRTLLLCTFPFLAISHFVTTTAFAVQSQRVGPSIALTGMYLFGIFYSFGEGPVPFVYASESMPLYCREVAMALVVSINWLFNWLIAFSGPWMFSAMGPAGTFAFYGGMCVVLWFIILYFVPETRLLKLEEIETVFEEVKTRKFGEHAVDSLKWLLYVTDKVPISLWKDLEAQRRDDRESEERQRAQSKTAANYVEHASISSHAPEVHDIS